MSDTVIVIVARSDSLVDPSICMNCMSTPRAIIGGALSRNPRRYCTVSSVRAPSAPSTDAICLMKICPSTMISTPETASKTIAVENMFHTLFMFPCPRACESMIAPPLAQRVPSAIKRKLTGIATPIAPRASVPMKRPTTILSTRAPTVDEIIAIEQTIMNDLYTFLTI